MSKCLAAYHSHVTSQHNHSQLPQYRGHVMYTNATICAQPCRVTTQPLAAMWRSNTTIHSHGTQQLNYAQPCDVETRPFTIRHTQCVLHVLCMILLLIGRSNIQHACIIENPMVVSSHLSSCISLRNIILATCIWLYLSGKCMHCYVYTYVVNKGHQSLTHFHMQVYPTMQTWKSG